MVATFIGGSPRSNNPNPTFQIFPNPAKNFLTVELLELKNIKEGSILLRNIMGEVLETQTLNGQQYLHFSTHQFADGIYFLELRINGNSLVKKVIISQ